MHSIRLRGPWGVEPVARFVPRADGSFVETTADLPPASRQVVPADWSEPLGGKFLGRVNYRRTFQSPTGLDGGQRVFLVVELQASRGQVSLGNSPLGETPLRRDITQLLEPRNVLIITLEHPALDASGTPTDDSYSHPTGGLTGEVRIEIEEMDK
ncbi:MAG: hypothetical protein IT425_01195 [Pirellulales bacterium]|nr:hypothetical protein [Pirellulales bacterium]